MAGEQDLPEARKIEPTRTWGKDRENQQERVLWESGGILGETSDPAQIISMIEGTTMGLIAYLSDRKTKEFKPEVPFELVVSWTQRNNNVTRPPMGVGAKVFLRPTADDLTYREFSQIVTPVKELIRRLR